MIPSTSAPSPAHASGPVPDRTPALAPVHDRTPALAPVHDRTSALAPAPAVAPAPAPAAVPVLDPVPGPTVRVAYLCKMFPRFSETFILGEVLELERQGADVHIFSLKTNDEGRFHADVAHVRAPVTYAPRAPGLRPADLWATVRAHVRAWRAAPGPYRALLAEVLRKRRLGAWKRFDQAVWLAPRIRATGATHIHAHFASSATTVARMVSRLTDIPYSFTAHAKDIFIDSVSEGSLRRKFADAAFSVTVSDFNRRYLSDMPGAERLVRIYNGLDLERFHRNGHAPIRPALILAVGRLVEKKGFDDLVRACAILKAEGVDFRCRIVGTGDQAGRLEALVAALDVGDRVELPGPLPRAALVDLIPHATAFAAPCVVGADGNRDGLPTVLVEAMALGVPVVATPVTGIPELVADGETGLLVPERDPAALAAALRRLLEDAPLRARLAGAARARVESAFDIRANVGVLHALFAGGGPR